MRVGPVPVLTIILSLASASSVAESMRCGPSVVDETTSIADLLAKCGEPATKDVTNEDVLVRNVDTGLMRKVGTKVTERWRYQRTNRALPMVVTIVDGKVTRLERAD
jgi:hypothetical protein